MDLEGVAPLDCCRLVKYDEFHEYLERSYEGEEDMPMGLLLGGVKSSYMFDLLLETRLPDQVFQPYKPGGKRPRPEAQMILTFRGHFPACACVEALSPQQIVVVNISFGPALDK